MLPSVFSNPTSTRRTLSETPRQLRRHRDRSPLRSCPMLHLAEMPKNPKRLRCLSLNAATRIRLSLRPSDLVKPRTFRSALESRTRHPPPQRILRMQRADHHLKMDNSQAAQARARQKPLIKR